MLEPREYSKRLGVLTHAQLQAALDRFGLGELRAAEPAPSGLFGQNVMLTTTRGAWVLRGAPWPAWQLRLERAAAEWIHTRTSVPAPWPYLVEESAELFGWSYALVPRLPGTCLASHAALLALPAADRLGVARALGEALAELHRPAWDAIASFDPARGTFAPLGRAHAEGFCAYARGWLARCRAASVATTEADAAWVESLIAAAAEALEVPFAPALLHTDYKENNVVLERDAAGSWRVTGVFDLQGCCVADGEYDLARFLSAHAVERPELAREFLAAYARVRGLRAGFAERFRLYLVTDRLILWEYGQRNRVWFPPGLGFRAYAEPGLAGPWG
jgi:aminoglycoside phosphotransferase (APT) family kinase protein